MRTTALSALALLALAACVSAPGAANTPAPFSSAAAAQPAAAAPGSYPVSVDLPAGEYRSDPHHTSVIWRIRHQGLAWLTGRFDTASASFTLDPADPSHSHIQATIDAHSVDTNVLGENGQRSFDNTISGWLGAEHTPQITFNSTSVERTGQNTARVTGDLTLNGQTHPAILNVTYDGGHTDPLRGHTALGFSAQTTIQRAQWGVTAMSQFTSDEVQIVIEMELVKS